MVIAWMMAIVGLLLVTFALATSLVVIGSQLMTRLFDWVLLAAEGCQRTS